MVKSWREIRIEQTLKQHDPKLFLNRNYLGELQVMRHAFRQVAYDLGNVQMINFEPAPHYIMSLTEDWTSRTAPVDWGLECISKKLREIDGWNPESVISNMEKHNAKIDASKKRAFENETEAFVKDWRSDFAKATSDILTHSTSGKDPREKGDRKYASN